MAILVERARDRDRWIVPVVLALVTVLLAIPHLGDPVLPMDEGISASYGDLVARGYVPHRDFQTLYGPGMPWLVATAFELLGTSVGVERAVAVACRLALVVGAAAFARRWGSAAALVSGLLCAALLARLSLFAYSALAAAACCVWSVTLLSGRDGRAATVGAGALSGAALLFRPDYALASIVPALVLLRCRSRASWLDYLAGLVVGLVPLATHAIVATPSAVLANLVTDASRAVSSRRLPLPPSDQDLVVLLLATVAVTVWALWTGAVEWSGRSARAGRALVAYAVFVALLMPQVMLRADRLHVGLLAALAGPLAALAMVRGIERRDLSPRGTLYLRAATIPVSVAIGVSLATAFPAGWVSRGPRSYPDQPSHAREVQAVVIDVDAHARPGMRLFVGPASLTRTNVNDTILYFLFPDLVPASYYLEMEPGTANRSGSRLAGDIASADLLILTTRWDGMEEPNDSRLPGSAEPDRVVAERFRLAERHGAYALYVRAP